MTSSATLESFSVDKIYKEATTKLASAFAWGHAPAYILTLNTNETAQLDSAWALGLPEHASAQVTHEVHRPTREPTRSH